MKSGSLSLVLLTAALDLLIYGGEGRSYLGVEAVRETLPTIQLPYGTWQASSYDQANDVSLHQSFTDVT